MWGWSCWDEEARAPIKARGQVSALIQAKSFRNSQSRYQARPALRFKDPRGVGGGSAYLPRVKAAGPWEEEMSGSASPDSRPGRAQCLGPAPEGNPAAHLARGRAQLHPRAKTSEATVGNSEPGLGPQASRSPWVLPGHARGILSSLQHCGLKPSAWVLPSIFILCKASSKCKYQSI